MIFFDIMLLLILAGFVFYGLFFGLIRTLGSIISFLGGLWLASLFYLDVFAWAQNLFFGYNIIGKLVCFFVLFSLINRLIAFGFVLLDRAFDIISIIPFLKTINRLAGAALGFIEGGMVLGFILYTLINNAILGKWFLSLSASSNLTPFLLKFAQVVAPMIPGLLNKLKTLI